MATIPDKEKVRGRRGLMDRALAWGLGVLRFISGQGLNFFLTDLPFISLL